MKNDNSYHYDKCNYYSGKPGGHPAPPSPPIQLSELPPPTNIPGGIEGPNGTQSRGRIRKYTSRRPSEDQEPPPLPARATPAASTPPKTASTSVSGGSDHRPTRRLIRAQQSSGRLRTSHLEQPPVQRAHSHSPVLRHSEIPASNARTSQYNPRDVNAAYPPPRANATLRGAILNPPPWAPNGSQTSSAFRNTNPPAYPPTNEPRNRWASLGAALPPPPPRVEPQGSFALGGAILDPIRSQSQYSANPPPSRSTGYGGASPSFDPNSVNNWLQKSASSQQRPFHPPANGAAASLARERDRTVNTWLRSRGYAP